MINQNGGMVPSTPEKMKRAEAVDLITLPPKISGTNCLNCKFVIDTRGSRGFCNHPEIKQLVTNRNCCAKWDQIGSIRQWEE